jgi:hypothetical protein
MRPAAEGSGDNIEAGGSPRVGISPCSCGGNVDYRRTGLLSSSSPRPRRCAALAPRFAPRSVAKPSACSLRRQWAACGPRRVEVVPLRSIIGTFALTVEFDGEFRPASERMRRRWERVALAHRQGVALPPIVVIRQPDGYYVVDGRHRVSVARALGHSDIDAWVSGPTGGLGGSASIDTALAA